MVASGNYAPLMNLPASTNKLRGFSISPMLILKSVGDIFMSVFWLNSSGSRQAPLLRSREHDKGPFCSVTIFYFFFLACWANISFPKITVFHGVRYNIIQFASV
jgi:hypothetical protein